MPRVLHALLFCCIVALIGCAALRATLSAGVRCSGAELAAARDTQEAVHANGDPWAIIRAVLSHASAAGCISREVKAHLEREHGCNDAPDAAAGLGCDVQPEERARAELVARIAEKVQRAP